MRIRLPSACGVADGRAHRARRFDRGARRRRRDGRRLGHDRGDLRRAAAPSRFSLSFLAPAARRSRRRRAHRAAREIALRVRGRAFPKRGGRERRALATVAYRLALPHWRESAGARGRAVRRRRCRTRPAQLATAPTTRSFETSLRHPSRGRDERPRASSRSSSRVFPDIPPRQGMARASARRAGRGAVAAFVGALLGVAPTGRARGLPADSRLRSARRAQLAARALLLRPSPELCEQTRSVLGRRSSRACSRTALQVRRRARWPTTRPPHLHALRGQLRARASRSRATASCRCARTRATCSRTATSARRASRSPTVHDDPDRLRTPLRRTPAGDFEPIAWDEAFDLAATRLRRVAQRHGARRGRASTWATRSSTTTARCWCAAGSSQALGTRNRYSAGSQDTSPRFAASYYLYGIVARDPGPRHRPHRLLPLHRREPDGLERQLHDRARHARAPARAARSAAASSWSSTRAAPRPRARPTSTSRSGRAATRRCCSRWSQCSSTQRRVDRARIARARARLGRDRARACAPFTPDAVARATGVPAETIVRLALEFADAPSARRVLARRRLQQRRSARSRPGRPTSEPRRRAARRARAARMFPTPAFDIARSRSRPAATATGAGARRVRGLPETLGDLPVGRAWPRRSRRRARARCARSSRSPATRCCRRRTAGASTRALAALDFMVSIDLYVNETTRHADVILPPAWALAEDHVDLLFAALVGAQRRALVAAGGRARRRRARRLGDPARARRAARRRPDAASRASTRCSRVAERFGLRWTPDEHRRPAAAHRAARRPLPAVVATGLSRAKLEAAPARHRPRPARAGHRAARLPPRPAGAPRAPSRS